VLALDGQQGRADGARIDRPASPAQLAVREVVLLEDGPDRAGAVEPVRSGRRGAHAAGQLVAPAPLRAGCSAPAAGV
jgi:hypothetical protein